jgi:single stranded DNA-binding protein
MRTTNQIRITGNLGADIAVSDRVGESDSETPIKLSVAESVYRKDDSTQKFVVTHTNWIPVTAFGSLAKRAAGNLKKGDRVTVLGSLKVSKYEKNGEKRSSYEVIASSIEKSQILTHSDQNQDLVPDFDQV